MNMADFGLDIKFDKASQWVESLQQRNGLALLHLSFKDCIGQKGNQSGIVAIKWK